MPGRPATRAKRELAVQRADVVGAVKAAEELGVPAATIRSWRRRLREEDQPVIVEASAPALESTPDGDEPEASLALDALNSALLGLG